MLKQEKKQTHEGEVKRNPSLKGLGKKILEVPIIKGTGIPTKTNALMLSERRGTA